MRLWLSVRLCGGNPVVLTGIRDESRRSCSAAADSGCMADDSETCNSAVGSVLRFVVQQSCFSSDVNAVTQRY